MQNRVVRLPVLLRIYRRYWVSYGIETDSVVPSGAACRLAGTPCRGGTRILSVYDS